MILKHLNGGRRDPRAALAAAVLAVGLLLKLFFHPAAHSWLIATHAAFGFCLGLSLTLNMSLLRHRRSCNPQPPLGQG
jgi:hypothetical protein